MGQAVGADVRHMDAYECAIGIDPALLVRGLLVNNQGQRFINEDTYPGRIAHAILRTQDNDAFLVIDERSYEESPEPLRLKFLRLRPTWAAASTEELEAEIGMPAGCLGATIDVFNRHAYDGVDPMFHKASKWVRPLEGSAGCNRSARDVQRVHAGRLGDVGRQRSSACGRRPHPRPVTAGRASNGIPAWGYASGTSLGDSTFFGRRAGRHAAARSPRANNSSRISPSRW